MRRGNTREAKWYVFLEKDEWFGANSAKINKKEKKRGGGGGSEESVSTRIPWNLSKELT